MMISRESRMDYRFSKFLIKLFQLFAIVALALTYKYDAFAASSQPIEVPACIAPVCTMTAKLIPLPTIKPIRNKILLVYAGFRISVPIPDKINIDNDAMYLLYPHKRALAIGKGSIPKELLSSGRVTITANQIPGIIFTKTSKDKEPKSLINRNVWRWALLEKSYNFSVKKPKVSTYTHEKDMTYYVYTGKDPRTGLTSAAMVTHTGTSAIYLYLHAKNVDKAEFKRIVYSIDYIH